MAWQAGDRVEMVLCMDPYAPIEAGDVGTVTGYAPPPINVLNVDWDSGRTLGVALDEDVVRKVKR